MFTSREQMIKYFQNNMADNNPQYSDINYKSDKKSNNINMNKKVINSKTLKENISCKVQRWDYLYLLGKTKNLEAKENKVESTYEKNHKAEMKLCTFNPKIKKLSYSSEKIQRENVVNRTLNWNQRRITKLKEMSIITKLKENEECIFKPQITRKPSFNKLSYSKIIATTKVPKKTDRDISISRIRNNSVCYNSNNNYEFRNLNSKDYNKLVLSNEEKIKALNRPVEPIIQINLESEIEEDVSNNNNYFTNTSSLRVGSAISNNLNLSQYSQYRKTTNPNGKYNLPHADNSSIDFQKFITSKGINKTSNKIKLNFDQAIELIHKDISSLDI